MTAWPGVELVRPVCSVLYSLHCLHHSNPRTVPVSWILRCIKHVMAGSAAVCEKPERSFTNSMITPVVVAVACRRRTLRRGGGNSCGRNSSSM